MNIKKWEKDPVERLHTQFYNYLKLLDNKEQVTLYLNIRHYIFLTILKKTIFLVNNANSFICKKLGYYICEALHIRETCILI